MSVCEGSGATGTVPRGEAVRPVARLSGIEGIAQRDYGMGQSGGGSAWGLSCDVLDGPFSGLNGYVGLQGELARVGNAQWVRQAFS